MPSSDCQLLISKCCPPPHLAIITPESLQVVANKESTAIGDLSVTSEVDSNGDVNGQAGLSEQEATSAGLPRDGRISLKGDFCESGSPGNDQVDMTGYPSNFGGTAKEGNIMWSDSHKETLCEALEKRHVHDVYEETAHHFLYARYKPWPHVKEFIEQLPPGSIVADVGEYSVMFLIGICLKTT